MASKIFISYRRQDSAAAAGRLYDFLESRVDKERLFKDVDDLPYGRDFREEIRRAIDDSLVVLVVIGRYFITEEKRLFRENDYVRYEIDYALKTGKTVIPVRVNEARMPTRSELPNAVSNLSMLHGPELRNSRWKDDCQDFWKKIEPLFPFIDPRDGQAYKTVKLIGKTWIAENLKFDVGEGCWFYRDNPDNGEKYGRLYTWEAAQKACPPGWRLPTDEEWKTMAESVGGYFDWPTRRDIGNPEKAYQALIEGGSSGFNGQLTGFRSSYYPRNFPNQNCFGLGTSGKYWSATECSAYYVWTYTFGSPNQKLGRESDGDKSWGHPCRCFHDF